MRFVVLLSVWTVAACSVSPVDSTTNASEAIVRESVLMGTRATLATYAAVREDGLQRLERALTLLESADSLLSTWRDDSTISELNRSPVGEPWSAGTALCPVFRDLEYWWVETGAAFDPAIGTLTRAWDIHGSGRVPDEHALAIAKGRSGWSLLNFDAAQCTITRLEAATLDVGAFGKGAALDWVTAAVSDGSWLIDLGGQVAVHGLPPGRSWWDISVAHPARRHEPFLTLRLPGGSLATSAGSESDRDVSGGRVGHILDPRTGYPAGFNGSATVWHAHALVADVLSTALFVMGLERGLQWAEDRNIAALFLRPTETGVDVHATSAFLPLITEGGPAAAWATTTGL